MAFQREKVKTYSKDLGSFIASQIIIVNNNRVTKNLDNESKFTNAVLTDNLTLDQQLEYRKQQLSDVDSADKTEKRRLKNEISKLNDLIERKKYSDSYLEEVQKLNDGSSSIDSTINWLTNRLANTTDVNIQDDIKKSINDLTAKRYDLRISALTKQTEFANNNKTSEILNTQINKINVERGKALLAGNDDLVSTLDLQLQSLNKSKTEAKINDASLKLAVDNIAGQSAIGTLNSMNSFIQDADTASKITIGGTTYDSEAQFWESQRTNYLTDRTGNGFFSRYKTEVGDQINYKQSKGILYNDSLADVAKTYDTLNDHPELKDYADKIALDKQSSMQTAADARATITLNKYFTDGNAQNAINDLAYIQDKYGVNQTENYQKVVAKAAQDKQQQVQEILSTMNSLMTATPGLSSQDALNQAIKTGAAATYSAEQLATTKASDIIANAAKTSEASQFGKTDTGTINPTGEAAPFTSPNANPAPAPKFTEGGLYKDPNSPTVMQFKGGKLSAFVGNWDEQKFQQATGKKFTDVQTVQNLTGAPQGEPIIAANEIKTPAPNTPAAPAKGELIADPGLLKYYGQDQIVKEGTNIYLKQGVKSVLGAKLNPASFTAMQKQYDPATLETKVVRSGKDIYLKN